MSREEYFVFSIMLYFLQYIVRYSWPAADMRGTTCPLYATTAICDKLPRYIIVAIILVPMSFSGRDLAPVQPPNISGFFDFLQCLF